jgi:hypothetical protein
MTPLHTYNIAIYPAWGQVLFSGQIKASSKKEAEDIGKEMAEAIQPILSNHYKNIGLGTLRGLRVKAWQE